MKRLLRLSSDLIKKSGGYSMLKKSFVIGLMFLMVMSLVTTGWCKNDTLKVGMVALGAIDDKSFNQGTWEGIKRAASKYKLDTKYLLPEGSTEADFLKEISNLHDAGYNLIFCPGFSTQTAVFQAQQKYPNTHFVQIDGAPHAGDFKPVIRKNTVAVVFAEHEAGFLAGIATALQLKECEAGFIGGVAVQEVQRFNWGFQQGLLYANKHFNTKITIKPNNVIYQGTFTDVAAGQQLAAQMYDKNVKVIFCAAGGVGIGVINEAKQRAKAGNAVWVVGVDRDQYDDGIYDKEHSIILTSAIKRVDQASFAMIKAMVEGNFPGGKSITFNAKSNGVGIPANNPNLTKEVQAQVNKILKQMQSGKIIVSDQQNDLIK